MLDHGLPTRDLTPPCVTPRDDRSFAPRRETLSWRRAPKADLPLIGRTLGALAEEYAAARLRYHADQAGVRRRRTPLLADPTGSALQVVDGGA